MSRIYYLIVLFYVFCGAANSQNSNKPILIGGNSPYYEDTDRLYHALENTQELFTKDPNGIFAIRVCSTDPLPAAFANATGVGYGVNIVEKQLDSLRNTFFLKIPESRIYFLRNTKGCRFYKKIPLTEYWFVPSYAEFPEFVEVRKKEDISSKEVISSYNEVDGNLISPEKFNDFISLTPEHYRTFKNSLLGMLKKEKSSLLLLEYVTTFGKSKNAILNEANQLKSFLTSRGIGKHRIFIKECIISCSLDNESTNSIYPNVTIIYQK